MNKKSTALKPKSFDTVGMVTFKDDGTPHMVFKNTNLAKKYCEIYPQFTWESWTVHKSLKETRQVRY